MPANVALILVNAVVAALTIAALIFTGRWTLSQPKALAGDAERESWITYLTGDPKMRAVRDSTTALFILAEAKGQAAGKLDAVKTIEAKASAQLSTVGGGIGLLSVFGASQPQAVAGPLPLLVWSAVFLLLSIVFNLLTVWTTRVDRVPAIDVFNSEALGGEPVMSGRIALSLAEGYADYSNELTAIVRNKSRRQQVAVICFLLGVGGLVLNSSYVLAHQTKPQPKAFDCTLGKKTLSCKESIS